jgi:hypothetical protein
MLWFLLACSGSGDGVFGSSSGVSAYSGLWEGGSWTWRTEILDDGALQDETELLRGKFVGDGVIGLRRGERWADAEDVGELLFTQTDEGLWFDGWSLDGASGQGGKLLEADPEPNELVVASGGQCVTFVGDTVETFYGVVEFALRAECSGGDGAGSYAFAQDVGLVQLDRDDLFLDLVAPY